MKVPEEGLKLAIESARNCAKIHLSARKWENSAENEQQLTEFYLMSLINVGPPNSELRRAFFKTLDLMDKTYYGMKMLED